MIDAPSPIAELSRELKMLRQEISALRATLKHSGLRSQTPTFNAVSGEEFTALFQAHRNLRDRVDALEKLIKEPTP